MSDEQKQRFLVGMERALCEENVEYEAKRQSERLAHPVLKIVAPGTYDRYKAARVAQGAAEAQIKVPNLSPDLRFGQDFQVLEEVGPS
jgi:hypothetical protein